METRLVGVVYDVHRWYDPHGDGTGRSSLVETKESRIEADRLAQDLNDKHGTWNHAANYTHTIEGYSVVERFVPLS